jgi:epidermal growth factor receptor substrate 15
MIPSEGSAPNGFNSFQSDFGSSTGGASGAGPAPKDGQHDWDAIFSGLDNSKNIDTSLNPSDPWGGVEDGSKSTATAAPAPGASLSAAAPPKDVPSRGGALTPGTEHDDPILKRLTGMGYPRNAALEALEKFDYDINKVSAPLNIQERSYS